MLEYKELGNTAVKVQPIYEPEYEYEPQIEPEKKKTGKRKLTTKEVPFKLKVKIISRVLFVTVLALLMVARFAAVSIANIGLVEAKNSVKQQQSKNSDLESILAAGMQLDHIEEKAIALGMSFPGSNQMVYVNLVPYEDLVKQNTSNTDTSNKNIIRQIID